MLYDADILAVELAPYIGLDHSAALRKAIKKAELKEPIDTIDNWQEPTWLPYTYDDNN